MNIFNDIIRINPEKRFGRPCVRETRIAVYDVLGWLSAGMTYDEFIILNYSDIVSFIDNADQNCLKID